jgi:hypothetical protein
LARAKRHFIPDKTEKNREEEWTHSIAVGSQPFVESDIKTGADTLSTISSPLPLREG